MSHALSALDHALRGDRSSLAFLEQTSSIYVLDAATAPPTTYGWWNVLNDALNDVEHYEGEGRHAQSSLDGHVRLLATITRKVARRPPQSDRRLVGTCVSNASSGHLNLFATTDAATRLVAANDELRERDMGRIAAIAFDYSFHRRHATAYPRSAFCDPVAMEQLCGAVAANAVSTGPAAVKHLVSDWIIPSVDNLPSLAVVAIMMHIALESMGKGCPAGTRDVISSLMPSVLKRTLGPILVESLRESDEKGEDAMVEAAGMGGENIEHRTAALALRALEAWSKANSIGAVKLRSIFASTNVNILEAIADALYSNSEVLIDAVSDLIETLLKLDAKEAKVALGLSITESIMSHLLPAGASDPLAMAQQVAGENEKSRIAILSELVSAVGLQRFRFAERQSNGDTAVCRCLVRTAARVLAESKDLLKTGSLGASPDGLLDLLFKAASHPSVYVCGIAVEALAAIAPSNSDLSTRLLPVLQGKAIIPVHMVGDTDGSLDDYINFRDRVLTGGLIACYSGCSTFYLESCGSAIDEFCRATPASHLPYQLEAALFCMIVVSERASKSADKTVLGAQLEKMVAALMVNGFSTTCHPLVMAKMCQFIGKYASCLKSCSSKAVIETASKLVMTSFNRCVNELNKLGPSATSKIMTPLSEACNALKELVSSSPDHFSTPEARASLDVAWKMPYGCEQVTIENREQLASGLCTVIVYLPSDQWHSALNSLTEPIHSCLNTLTREAEMVTSSPGAADGKLDEKVAALMTKLSSEIRLLAAVVRCFSQADTSKNFFEGDQEKMVTRSRSSLVALLRKSWPCLIHIGKKLTSYEVIARAMGQLLTDCLSLYGSEEELPFLLEITGLAKTSLGVVAKAKKPHSVPPFLSFVTAFLTFHGSKVEPSPSNNASNESIQAMAKDLMLLSYEAVRSCSEVDDSQAIASPMFDTLSSCAKKCPIFLLGLSRDGQPVGEIIRSSLETVPTTLQSNELNVVLSSIRFLQELVSSLTSASLDLLSADDKAAIAPVADSIKRALQADILIIAISSTCAGMSPPELLEPFTELTRAILVFSQWPDIEPSVSAAINCPQFQLGDEAKAVAFDAFKKCTESQHVAASFRTMVSDMWEMHSTDDTGSIAGRQAVLDFVQKYK